MSEHTPTPWLREDCTVYSLNRFDANRFNCTVQPGFDEYDQRASAAECAANADFIVRAVNHFDELVAALKTARKYVKRVIIDKDEGYAPDLEEIDAVLSKLGD